MRLIEDPKVPDNGGVKTNGVNGSNGLHLTETDSEEEEELEPEPVSGTLVLRVISEPASPSVSRKPSVRRDQPPAFLTDSDRGEQFLQVQVQRSTSSHSLTGSRHERSRPSSATPSFYITDTDTTQERFTRQSTFSSRESSTSPTPSFYITDTDTTLER